MQSTNQELFPRAILHVDGDSFFVACELTKFPHLKGQPVVTGLERGIASAMSYEARARGITRAMKLSDIRKLCPDAVILNSDYVLYEQYSERMNTILRRYTNQVESYSIDESFVDITGLDAKMRMSYEEIAQAIKRDLEQELGVTFSIGVSVTKSLAKIASDFQKPSGLTMVSSIMIDQFLAKRSIDKVWGIGHRTVASFRGWGVLTALQFKQKDHEWVARHFSKPYQEIHHELQGTMVHSVKHEGHRDYKSLSRTQTFQKKSQDESYVLSQLSHNIEKACRALRSKKMFARKVSIFLKTQQFTYSVSEFQLPYAVATPGEILKYATRHFHALFQKGVSYRATGITVSQLSHGHATTLNLFSENTNNESALGLYKAIDAVNHKYGRETLLLGSSMRSVKRSKDFGRRLGIPSLGFVM